MNRRFSSDPKVKVVSLEFLLSGCDYLPIEQENFWELPPAPFSSTYKVTDRFFIYLWYTCKNFGPDMTEKLEEIEIAYRDGVTEYQLFNRRICELQKEVDSLRDCKSRKEKREFKELSEKLEAIQAVLRKIPAYHVERAPCIKREFREYLCDLGYITRFEELRDQAVVFDVETNGLRRAHDDLLSLSIYDPSTGMCYNRYFPLEQQPLVLTGYINGISEDDLQSACHWTQEEIDEIIDYFHLKERKLLSYSGGKGEFDKSFILHYCQRHKLHGFEDLDYGNIKSLVQRAPFGCGGQLSKDNLCRLLGIAGVTNLHTSANDCLLEWKLYETLVKDQLFMIQNTIYRYSPEYIIPVSYLNSQKCLAEYANLKVPYLLGVPTLVYQFRLPEDILCSVRKFPTNITGITLEEGIRHRLRAVEQDTVPFLLKNKSCLEAVAVLESSSEEIPIVKTGDGAVQTSDPEYAEFIRQVNDVTETVVEALTPVIEYIKNDIFREEDIFSQELVISKDRKVLALCDFSSPDAVLEMKTYPVIENDGYLKESLSRQLYYQANGRKTYAMSIVFRGQEDIGSVDDVTISIYEVRLIEETQSGMI